MTAESLVGVTGRVAVTRVGGSVPAEGAVHTGPEARDGSVQGGCGCCIRTGASSSGAGGPRQPPSAFHVSGLCIYNQPFVYEGKGFLFSVFRPRLNLCLDSGQKCTGGEK